MLSCSKYIYQVSVSIYLAQGIIFIYYKKIRNANETKKTNFYVTDTKFLVKER
jgi:hypothetical protein